MTRYFCTLFFNLQLSYNQGSIVSHLYTGVAIKQILKNLYTPSLKPENFQTDLGN